MTDDPDRGTGRTTRQMKEAPQGAIFIWCAEGLAYPRGLAEKAGRRDLRIEPLSRVRLTPEWLRGTNRPIVVDHEAMVRMTARQWHEIAMLNSRISASATA